MTIKLKSGIIKPKQIFNQSHILHPVDPTTYLEASKNVHWLKAMSQEFQAL